MKIAAKRFMWRLKKYPNVFCRNYKGLCDVLAVILFLVGVAGVAYGVLLALCEEYVSIMYISGGGMGLLMADDLFWLDRKRSKRKKGSRR